MKSDFFKFLKASLIFVSGFLLVDALIGWIGDTLVENVPETGTRISQQYAANKKVQADVIILGSSRANHHYNAPMMRDMLSLSVYNTGIDGCGLHYNSCVLYNVIKRKVPKLVIFELEPTLLSGRWKERLKNDLGIYYYKDSYIHQTLNEIEDITFPVKIRVNTYRYNNIFISLFNTFLINKKSRPLGYAPLESNQKKFELTYAKAEPIQIDSMVYQRLMDMIAWSKKYHFALIVVESPKLVISNTNAELKQICENNNILYLDNTNVDYFMQHPYLFNDPTHLNKQGADVYTKYFINQIKFHIDI